MTGETPNKEPKREEEKPKVSETLDSLKKNKKIESLIDYAKANTQDTIAYVLMVLGILMVLISIMAGGHAFYGGLLVGLVAGFYFSVEIMNRIRDFNAYIEKEGIPKSLILGGLLVSLFIVAPGVFIGAAIATGIRQIIKG